MPRPGTKQDLLKAANEQFENMWAIFDAMPEKKQTAAFHFGDAYAGKEAHWARDKNLRDVFVHLYEWHRLLLNWVEANESGRRAPFLPAPYNWKTYGQMNVAFWEKHQNTPLGEAIELVKKSHAGAMKLIEEFSDAELFEKGRIPWTGASTLGSYFVSATASHYAWAIKKMKAHNKTDPG